jgi:uncharacterized membrane protein
MRTLRNAFFTGLLLCLPLAITIYVVRFLVELTSKPAQGMVSKLWFRALGHPQGTTAQFWVEQSSVLLSALVVVAVITLVGMFSRYLLGRFIISMLEKLINQVPVIKSVYSSIKQIVFTFGAKNKQNFKQVVLVQFPHQGVWTVAFVTNRDHSELSEKLGYPVVHVFVPTTPNPTGGYFLVFRESDVKVLQMSVAEGMKLVISGGSVLPETWSPEIAGSEKPKVVS